MISFFQHWEIVAGLKVIAWLTSSLQYVHYLIILGTGSTSRCSVINSFTKLNKLGFRSPRTYHLVIHFAAIQFYIFSEQIILTWQNRSFHLGNACGHQPHCCCHVYVDCQKPSSDICSHILSETKARQINFMATIWMKTTGFNKFCLLVVPMRLNVRFFLLEGKYIFRQNEKSYWVTAVVPKYSFPNTVCLQVWLGSVFDGPAMKCSSIENQPILILSQGFFPLHCRILVQMDVEPTVIFASIVQWGLSFLYCFNSQVTSQYPHSVSLVKHHGISLSPIFRQ